MQLWRCASCKRMFTPGPAAIRNKTYPLRTVIDALSTYSLGYSLEETAKRIKSKSGRAIGSLDGCGLARAAPAAHELPRLRDRGRHLFPPEQTIRSIKLYHRQIYGYAFHRPKLEFLRRGELDDKRSGDARFAPLANFLEAVPLDLPARSVSRRGSRPRLASAARIRRCLAHHRQPQRERRDTHRRPHHPGRRQQQAAARDAAEVHAHQRQRDGGDRDPDLACGAGYRRTGATAWDRARAAGGCGRADDHRPH